MTRTPISPSPIRDPIAALAAADAGGVLAVITGVDGPSYRPLGAYMAILNGQDRVGTLSSGCIEQDLVLHARAALASGKPATVLYGRGSPFIDIQLPCGGGLEILLVPSPDRAVLSRLADRQRGRRVSVLLIDRTSGAIRLADDGKTGDAGPEFSVRIEPELFFYIVGKGPEASTFAALVQSAGFPNLLISPDRETLEIGENAGCDTRHIKAAGFPDDLAPDQWSSVVLFFHDHEWEPPILKGALETRAFYVGAQGSRRARDARLRALGALGVSSAALARLKGPIGLVPSARDARTLAVSVLAEILSRPA